MVEELFMFATEGDTRDDCSNFNEELSFATIALVWFR